MQHEKAIFIKQPINIFDKITHPNMVCQNTKKEWNLKNCGDFNFANNEKKRDECKKLFDAYYECFINDITKTNE
jgi:hypothetical protein